MRITISRVVLFVVSLALILAALLPSLAGSVGAAPPMLITEVPTAEPPTRTPASTSAPTNTPLPGSTPIPTNTPLPGSTPIPTNTPLPGSSPVPTDTPPPGSSPVPTATPISGSTPTSTNIPSPTTIPTHTSSNSGRNNPTETPTLTNTPTLTPTLAPTLIPVPTSIPQTADPAITKLVNHSTVAVGDTVDFTIRVTNLGDTTAGSVVAEDVLPDFLALDHASATRGDVRVNGNSVQVTIGDLAPGEIVTITISARVVATATPPDNYNGATVSTSSLTDNPANNRSRVSLNTGAPPTLTTTVIPALLSIPETTALHALLPSTAEPKDLDTLPLLILGIGMIVASLFIRWRMA